ncbi:MAG: hypothetical protein J6K52_01070 [Clostridia bacterium]|nr:hypothetical protein [Clostridia bacterium]MBQ7789155.1 hypothetical protein [Clostridia bacterium]
MKKIALILSALLLCLSLFGCGTEDEVPQGMKLASDSQFYNLYVPEGWQINQQTPSVCSAQVSDKNRTNVNVMWWQTSDGYKTHDDFSKEYKERMNETLTEVKFLSTKAKSVYGDSAKEYIFTAKEAGIYYKFHTTVVLERGIFFVITFTFMQDPVAETPDSVDDVVFTTYQNYMVDSEICNKIITNFKVK